MSRSALFLEAGAVFISSALFFCKKTGLCLIRSDIFNFESQHTNGRFVLSGCCLAVCHLYFQIRFGGALGALSAPLMLTILPAKVAAILLPLYLMADFWTVDLAGLWSELLIWMVVIAVIGQFLGYLFIEVIDDNTLKAVIGALALVTGARYWFGVLKPKTAARPGRPFVISAAAFVSVQQSGAPYQACPAFL